MLFILWIGGHEQNYRLYRDLLFTSIYGRGDSRIPSKFRLELYRKYCLSPVYNRKLNGLVNAMESLPNSWAEIKPDTIYQTTSGQLVSFSQEQIQFGIKYDQNHKHIKAIEKGIVAPRGNIGLVPSEVEGFDFKSKVLGKGGDRRFHGKIINGVLHFPAFITEH